jgi:hypothetical protein
MSVILGETYVNRNKKCHRSNNPRGDICKQDLWLFLFLFTYVSPRITRPVAILISIYIFLPWDYSTCGLSYFYLHISPLGLLDLGLVIPGETYVNRKKKGHKSSNPRGDICK